MGIFIKKCIHVVFLVNINQRQYIFHIKLYHYFKINSEKHLLEGSML